MNTLEKILEEIKTLKAKQNNGNRDYYVGYMSALSTIEGFIAGLKENDGWIPVSERLPDDNNPNEECVLVTVNGKCRRVKFNNAVMIGGHYLEGWVIDGWEDWTNPNVTAWMPLPEGYAKEGNKQC